MQHLAPPAERQRNLSVVRGLSSVRQSPIHFLLKSFISQNYLIILFFSCLVWSFLKNVTMHCKRKLWVGVRVCVEKGEALDRGKMKGMTTDIDTTDIDDVRYMARPVARPIMRLQLYDHIRYLCELKSQFKSFEQLVAIKFASTIVHDHPQSPTITHDPCDQWYNQYTIFPRFQHLLVAARS